MYLTFKRERGKKERKIIMVFLQRDTTFFFIFDLASVGNASTITIIVRVTAVSCFMRH